MHKREIWSSRIGFILATSGAAIGLGNIQRFPYIAAESGGALFLFIYFACILLITFPLMLLEFSIGRKCHQNPVESFKSLSSNKRWGLVGLLGVLTAFFILTYYLVISGWTLGFIALSALGKTVAVETLAASPLYTLTLGALFLAITASIVMRGVQKGIEKWSRYLMPVLLFLLLLLVVRSFFYGDKGYEGFAFFLKPDFSELNWKIFLLALGQAFFSLSVGEAVLLTYGSYTSKHENLITSALYIALFDTLIAVLAGLAIFPALFAFSEEPTQGITLSFVVLPKIFSTLPFGSLLSTAFFLLLAFAALTTCMALLEIPSRVLMDKMLWSRRKAVLTVSALAYVCFIPSALSYGASDFFSSFEVPCVSIKGFYALMDFTFGNIAMVLVGFLMCLFTLFVWGIEEAKKELARGAGKWKKILPFWGILIRFVAPFAIALILIQALLG